MGMHSNATETEFVLGRRMTRNKARRPASCFSEQSFRGQSDLNIIFIPLILLMKQRYVIALATLAIAIYFYVGLTHFVFNPTHTWIVSAKDAQQTESIRFNPHVLPHFKNQQNINEK